MELLSREDQLRRLRRDPGLIPSCVEECLRYASPIQMTKPRFIARDMEWMGRQFKRGDMFAALLAAGANAYPFATQYACWQIQRPPRLHLALSS